MTPVVVWLATLGGCWLPPVPGPVVAPFVAPPCTWCPGHRGVEFDTIPGEPVANAVAGEVVFAGVVVGRRYVTIAVSGVQPAPLVTYGPLAAAFVAVGDGVVAGQAVGLASDQLMVSVRINGTYVDPEQFLGHWAWPVRLIPTDGAEPRSPPAPSLVCGRPPLG